MTFSGIITSWCVLFAMAVTAEYGDQWQASNAQLTALAVVVVLNIIVIRQLAALASQKARRHWQEHRK